MDLSDNDVLLLLGGIALAACVACAWYRPAGRGATARRRSPAARTHRPAERRVTRIDVEDSGRHRVPEALLQAPTYRLSADRRARARVPGTGRSAHPRRRRIADSASGATR
jgi:hypothetical protein